MNKHVVMMVMTAFLLAGCGSEAEVSAGLEVELKATNTRLRPVPVGLPSAEEASTKIFRTNEDQRIELQAGYLNLLPLELLRDCGSLAARRWPSLIGSAQAHGAAGDASGAGLIDVVEPDGSEFDLGALAPAPGTYCGIRVALAPLVVDSASGDFPPQPGSLLSAYPCYYPDSAGVPEPLAAGTPHSCIQVVVPARPAETLLRFAEPVQVRPGDAPVHLTLGVRYDTWFDGLDMAALPGSAEEQAKLLENLWASLHLQAGH